jgi:hypothetical protein
MSDLWLDSVALLVAGLAAIPIVQATARTPVAGFWVVATARIVTEAAVVAAWTLPLVEVDIDLAEFAALLLLPAIFLRLFRRPQPGRVAVLGVAGVLFSAALARGMLAGGGAPLEIGNHALLLVGLAYGMTFSLATAEWRALDRALQQAATVLIVVFALIQLGLLPGTASGVTLGAGSAFLIALALIARVLRWMRSTGPVSGTDAVVAVVFAAALALLQHRTLWVVLGIALIYLLVTSGMRATRLVAAGFVLLVAVATLDLLGVQSTREGFTGESLAASLQQATEDTGNFDWRVRRWEATIATNLERGADAVWLGAGYGQPWVTVGPHAARTEPPHNLYVEVFVRFGILGLLAWLGLLLAAIVRLWRRSRTEPNSIASEFALLTILAMMAWSITYTLVGVQPLLLGLALGAALGSDDDVVAPTPVRRASG